jgi:hypothetical protein
MEKITNEDVKVTQRFEKDDKSQSEYTISSSPSSLDNSFKSIDSIVFGNKKIKKYKKPSYVDYLNRFGQDYADHWQSYYLWRRNFPKDPIGTFRPLTDPEKSYFDFAKQYYQHIPTRRTSEHSFFFPPAPWQKRLQLLTPPDQFITQIDALIQFSNKFCQDSERNNWNDVNHVEL